MLGRLRPRTLRARLTCGLLLLFALGCATVGVAAVLTLRGFLTQRLDQQLQDSGGRFPASLEHDGTLGPPAGQEPDDDGVVDTRRQAPGTFGARLLHGRVTRAAAVPTGSSDTSDTASGTAVTLTAGERAALAAVPVDGRSYELPLSALRQTYRVRAIAGRDGDVLITGLPLSGVEDAVHDLEIVEAAVFGGALVVAGVSGALWVRWQLRPLDQVAATAAHVAQLPLDSGEVTLPVGTAGTRTDPGSEVGQVEAALGRMLGHVEDALAKRQTSEERLRRFAADASHELRTPVASIRGHAELALRHPDPVPPEVTRALERVAAESARMGEMVDDLLLLARLDAGRPLEREPVDLTRLVLDGVDDARAAGPGHRWTLDLPEEPVIVTGDAHRLKQALGNLLTNARVHTPAGTTVCVRLAREDGDGGPVTSLSVGDDGPGVPEAIRGTLFERFTRADRRQQASGPSGGGAGLGMSIVAGVAAAHGGTVGVDSRPGATVFTVRLPEPAAPGRPAPHAPPEGAVR